MRTDLPKTVYLKDYRPYPFEIESLELDFDIHDGYTTVSAKSVFKRKDGHKDEALYLHGEALELLSLKIDGQDFDDYETDHQGLTIQKPGDNFALEIKTRIKPEENTRLEGLYKSGGTYCTQCEAEGFRRITYFPDRPDVMTTYTVRITADKAHYPVLLSNGNRIDHGDVDDKHHGGRHFAVWQDPHPKPCYLFALVAGDLNHIEDEFITKSGRKVELYIYVRPGDESQCDHAMESLKKSMKWDEDVYGLEYDLDLFNIVAVSDFNMGAMENKSLNIFNTALVLAHQDTATDQDFMRVESVIAHEYFHNWSGNRVTCRDWFQLSLKEGLTVFRDQEFSADMHSPAVQRIDDVSHLRRLQFAEDAGPLAHPVRPDNYIEINNFYTMTVYEKGAEVIRMTRNIVGEENYYKAAGLYFERFDGQAVTCDDWVACMEEASSMDLSQFKLWYAQAGTPEIHVRGIWNEKAQNYVFEIEQSVPATPGQPDKKPMHIPVRVGLIGQDGHDLKEQTLHLTEAKQSFVLDNISEKPVPSILRDFSAPVRVKAELSDDELAFLMIHDSDGFNRWESAQTLYLRTLHGLINSSGDIQESFLSRYGEILDLALDPDADKALMARMLSLPDVSRIGQERETVDIAAIYKVRQKLLAAIKRTHRKSLDKLYKENRSGDAFLITAEAMGQRALQNVALGLLTATNGSGCAKLSKAQYDAANTMTDRVAALSRLADNTSDLRDEAYSDYYERFKNHELAIDKWFALQAMGVRKEAMADIKHLRGHEAFTMKNPNRVRSLYAAFAMNNPVLFHDESGAGYDFLADAVAQLNTINPQIGARLLTPLREWRRYKPVCRDQMKEALERILRIPDIAPDIYEIASKSLQD